MIDINDLIQSFGIWTTLALGAMAVVYYLARGYFASTSADAKQQTVVTQMAAKAQQRAINLEEARYRALIKSNKLLMRVQRLEVELRRLPLLEAEVKALRAEIILVKNERDDALKALNSERIKNAELMGRISALEDQTNKLEDKLRRLQHETQQVNRGDNGDTRPLLRASDVLGHSADGGDSGGDSSSGGRGDDGERSRDAA